MTDIRDAFRALRATPVLQEEFRTTLGRTVGMAGRTLLVQVAEPV